MTAVATRPSAATEPTNTKPARRRVEPLLAWLFLAPSVIVFAVFVIYPLIRSVYLSFHGSDIFGGASAFVGWDNYSSLFTPGFGKILGVTAAFVVLTVVPGVVGGLLIVLLLEAKIRGARVFRTAFALPFAFSVASASVIFAVIFNPAIGLANAVLEIFGIGPQQWLTSPNLALVSICITTVWMNLGYNVLVLSAGIGTIPSEVIEAAKLDGATGLRLARRILVPLMSPQLFFLTVVTTIQSLQGFGQIHLLTKGQPDGATTTLVYSIYLKAFANGASDYGTASAQAMVLLIIVVIATGLQFGGLSRRVHYR